MAESTSQVPVISTCVVSISFVKTGILTFVIVLETISRKVLGLLVYPSAITGILRYFTSHQASEVTVYMKMGL